MNIIGRLRTAKRNNQEEPQYDALPSKKASSSNIVSSTSLSSKTTVTSGETSKIVNLKESGCQNSFSTVSSHRAITPVDESIHPQLAKMYKKRLSLCDQFYFLKFVVQKHKQGYIVLLLPFVVFAVIASLGCIFIGDQSHRFELAELVTIRENTILALDTINEMIMDSVHPNYFLAGIVDQETNATKIAPNFYKNKIAANALKTTRGGVVAVQYAPNGVVSLIYPSEGNEQAFGLELLRYRRADTLETVRRKDVTLFGPKQLIQGYTAIIAQSAVYVDDVDRDDKFGQTFDIMDFGCDCCYNNQTRQKVWGIVTSIIKWDNLQSKLSELESKFSYRYELSSVLRNETTGHIIGKTALMTSSTPPMDKGTRTTKPIEPVTVKMFNLEWVLHVEPDYSITPKWRTPLNISTVITSFLLSLIIVNFMLNEKHRELLLLAILPAKVLKSMKDGEQFIEEFEHVAVLFTDIVGFTPFAATITPRELATFLHELYTVFDGLVSKHGVYKIETIGDAFVCTCGCPYEKSPEEAAEKIAMMALDMIETAKHFVSSAGHSINIRAGIHLGPLVGCVMGSKSPRFCIVGDTVNYASRMESTSLPQQVHASDAIAAHLLCNPKFSVSSRGEMSIKGKGNNETFWIAEAAEVEDVDETGFEESSTIVSTAPSEIVISL